MPGAKPPESGGELISVLLHEEGAEPSARLVRALEKKRIRITACTDPFRALACLIRASRDSGVALPILVLEEPHRIGGKAGLLGLAGVYAPRAVFWMYTSEPPEQVREIREADLEAWRQSETWGEEPPVVHTRPVGSKEPPQLRIVQDEPDRRPAPSGPMQEDAEPEAGDPGEAGGRTEGEADSGGNAEPLLTDEELSMLLDEPEDERNGGRG